MDYKVCGQWFSGAKVMWSFISFSKSYFSSNVIDFAKTNTKLVHLVNYLVDVGSVL